MGHATDRGAVKDILQRELPYLRAKYGVTRLALYGSVARGTDTAASDIDLLVELERPLGFDFVALVDYLEQALGRRVDLATFASLERSMSSTRYRPIALRIQETLTDVAVAP